MGEEETCSNCRRWEVELFWTHFQSIHFSQFLHPGFHQRLDIPELFTKKLKKKLPEVVFLKGPSGCTWEVGLTTINNTLFFNHGWPEFVKDHFLEENDFLIFKYNGESHFDVLVFDGQSMCEKATSYFVKKSGQRGYESGVQMKRTSGESSVEVSIDSLGDVVGGSQTTKPTITAEMEGDKMNAVKLAQAVLSRNGFIIVMKPTHVKRKFFMQIPSAWVIKHLSLKNQDVILRIKERTWLTGFLYLQNRRRGALSKGWKKFVVDNNLREFDVCLFEPCSTANNSIILDVNIFRAV